MAVLYTSPFDAAFPRSGSEEYPPCRGMSMREWYAGMALQGICSNPGTGSDLPNDVPKLAEFVAKMAFQVADAMLEQSQK